MESSSVIRRETNKVKHHKSSSLWGQVIQRLLKNNVALAGLGFLIFIFLFSFIGSLFSPYINLGVDPTAINKPPSAAHC